MARSGHGAELFPWLLTAIGLSVFSLYELSRWHDDYTILLIPAAREPVGFSETFAYSFLVVSLAIWLGGLQAKDIPVARLQTVDIQFISPADYTDQNSPLPGTKTDGALKKRTADERTVQASPAEAEPVKPKQVKTATSAAADQPAKKESEPVLLEKQVPRKRLGKSASAMKLQPQSNGNVHSIALPAPTESQQEKPAEQEAVLSIPSGWSTKKTDAPPVVPSLRKKSESRQEPLIAEVKPVEMVELVENDGENNGLQVFQRGGDSTGGKGKENGLSRYLKDLHRKIKSAWNPPKGDSHRVELIFRIKHDGKLAAVKVSGSSGEVEIDRSAIGAIIGATRRPVALPADYQPAYLDVLYTFNYNVDELQEVHP